MCVMALHMVALAGVETVAFHPVGALLATTHTAASAAMCTPHPLVPGFALDAHVSAFVLAKSQAFATLLLSCSLDVLAPVQQHSCAKTTAHGRDPQECVAHVSSAINLYSTRACTSCSSTPRVDKTGPVY